MSTWWRKISAVALSAMLVSAGAAVATTSPAHASGEMTVLYNHFARRDGGGYAINSTGVPTGSASMHNLIDPARANQAGQRGYAAWCIQRHVMPAVGGFGSSTPMAYNLDMAETAKLPRQVAWIAANSHPVITVDKLSQMSGIKVSQTEVVVSATQAAIWHYTDGTDLKSLGGINKTPTGAGSGFSGEAIQLYNWFLQQADKAAPTMKQPSTTATLSVNKSQARYAEGKVGPFIIEGAKDFVSMTLSTGKLVYADGAAVDLQKVDATQALFVQVSGASGSIDMQVQGDAVVQPGLVYAPEQSQYQKVVSVGGWGSRSQTSATFQWSGSGTTEQKPKPQDGGTSSGSEREVTPPTVTTEISQQNSNPGAKIHDTVIIEGIRDKSLNYTVTGALYGPLPAKGGSCANVDFSQAPVAMELEPFRVIEDGRYINIGPYTIPNDANNACYSYGERLVVSEKSGKKLATVMHAPGKVSQTTLVTRGEAGRGNTLEDHVTPGNKPSQGDQGDTAPSGKPGKLVTKPRPLGETGSTR